MRDGDAGELHAASPFTDFGVQISLMLSTLPVVSLPVNAAIQAIQPAVEPATLSARHAPIRTRTPFLTSDTCLPAFEPCGLAPRQ